MANFRLELAAEIIEHPGFKKDFDLLNKSSMLPLVDDKPIQLPTDVTSRLLRSAVIFSQTREEEFETLAQDIAFALLKITRESATVAICEHILASVGNFPAKNHIRSLPNFDQDIDPTSIPWLIKLEDFSREIHNQIYVDGSRLTLTDFQHAVWSQLASGASISVSAPTSAGKSFVIQRFLSKEFKKSVSQTNIAYVVPSRALISEVQATLTNALSGFGDNLRISSVPRVQEDETYKGNYLFVVTQERLQTILDTSDITFHRAIVDEAQQISDGARGILLQQCLEQLCQRNPSTAMLFLTPSIESSEAFQSLLQLKKFASISSNFRPVRQNLIFANFSPDKPTSIQMEMTSQDRVIDIGEVKSKRSFEDPRVRLAGVALDLGGRGQSLVYASGKADAEGVAVQIMSELQEVNDDEINALVKFIKEHIHPDYLLAETVKRRVGFHYGNMPTVLRQTLESYFSRNILKYLVCTSTLLHGVNLPARNIFLYKPTRGEDQPISKQDFWNLAGRAGRLGMDIEGNVFLIDYASWKNRPLEPSGRHHVRPSIVEMLTTRRKELLSYILDSEHPSGREHSFAESTFTKVFTDYRQNKLADTLTRARVALDDAALAEIETALGVADAHVTLPTDIILRSRTVSPMRQQELFNYFLKKIAEGKMVDIIPLHPAGDWRAVYNNLLRVLKRIHNHLEKRKRQDRSHTYFAGLALKWMRGTSLRQLIDDHIQRKIQISARSTVNKATAIREMLDSIENDLRFRYVQYTSCYIELLNYAISIQKVANPPAVPALPLYLELGACSGTMVSFIELGLSRISANELASKTADSAMDATQAKEWLKRSPLNVMGLSPIIAQELKQLGLISER